MNDKSIRSKSIIDKFKEHFNKKQHVESSSRASSVALDIDNEERELTYGKKTLSGSSTSSSSSNNTINAAAKPTVFSQNPTSVIILVLLVAEAIAIVIMESFIIFYHSAMFSQCQLTLVAIGLSQVDLIYHGLFAITPIYQILLYLDALHQRNTIHILILILFGVLSIIFAGLQTIQHISLEKAGCDFSLITGDSNVNSTLGSINGTAVNNTITASSSSLKMLAIIRNETSSTIYFKDTFDELISNMKPFEYACLVFVPVCFLFMVAGIIFLYRSFKWNTLTYHLQRYPDGDSSSSYKNALIAWSTFTSLLKLDFFFLLAYSVQLIPSATVGYEVPAFEGVLIFCLSLIMLSIAMYSARTENMKSLSFFCLASIGFIGYFGYRLFTFGIHREGTTGDPYAFTRYNLVYATLTVILLMIMTLATSLICIRYVLLKKLRLIGAFYCTCSTCFYSNENVLTSAKDEDTSVTENTHSVASPEKNTSDILIANKVEN